MSFQLGVNQNLPIVTSEITLGGAANTYYVCDGRGGQAFVSVSMNFCIELIPRKAPVSQAEQTV